MISSSTNFHPERKTELIQYYESLSAAEKKRVDSKTNEIFHHRIFIKAVKQYKEEREYAAHKIRKTVYFDKELLEMLHNFAYQERCSLTEALNIVLKDGLQRKNCFRSCDLNN